MNREFLEKLGLEKEVIDSIMKEHGKTIQSVKPEDYDDIKTENKTLKDTVATLETSLKDFEGYEDKLTEKDNKIKEYEIKNLKYRIANENGIPLELASKLSGETEEDLKKDAETLSSFITKKQTLPLRTTETKTDDEVAPYKEMLDNLKLD
ncbi:MAG: phage scaffold protein [Tissierella sp.]|nr:phage scaffold protein [Tissierella sp.]